ncbi:MAG TPA: hypothetical protein VGX25_16230 [Actinophytocola sp.]|uniref:hypothetical protein n=1 Tax=Actinophytocola sp. TaxID=1872138 RepID=UPI002DDD8FF1|nr:hypothetical protein [Actinophytocola sp.]HEV2780932.1 hypothetical protein [Actinophytocola sp.]
MVKKDPSRNGAGARFEEAAERIAAEIRRLDDIGDDVRRRLRELRWTGRSADSFRRHAVHQAVRAGHNRELMESLRVMLIRAAQVTNAATRVQP